MYKGLPPAIIITYIQICIFIYIRFVSLVIRKLKRTFIFIFTIQPRIGNRRTELGILNFSFQDRHNFYKFLLAEVYFIKHQLVCTVVIPIRSDIYQ